MPIAISLLNKIVDAISNYVNISSLEEFTIEANPEDVTEQWVKAIIQLGINRVSMGIQSFNNDELMYINRRHTAEVALTAIQILQRSGITCISGDLIYGLPGQDLESWKQSLKKLKIFSSLLCNRSRKLERRGKTEGRFRFSRR